MSGRTVVESIVPASVSIAGVDTESIDKLSVSSVASFSAVLLHATKPNDATAKTINIFFMLFVFIFE